MFGRRLFLLLHTRSPARVTPARLSRDATGLLQCLPSIGVNLSLAMELAEPPMAAVITPPDHGVPNGDDPPRQMASQPEASSRSRSSVTATPCAAVPPSSGVRPSRPTVWLPLHAMPDYLRTRRLEDALADLGPAVLRLPDGSSDSSRWYNVALCTTHVGRKRYLINWSSVFLLPWLCPASVRMSWRSCSVKVPQVKFG